MKTSIVGYPRVGSLRELKFASEKYFRKEITETELQETAKTLRFENLKAQKESGLDFIPSNDFSFYDGILDKMCIRDRAITTGTKYAEITSASLAIGAFLP